MTQEIETHTVRGVTGTISQLMVAFGVRVGKSVVHRRMNRGGMSLERALLYSARKPPTRPNDPLPIPDEFAGLTPWERAERLSVELYGCDLREALMALSAMGCDREQIAEQLGLMITPQHHDGLVKKVAAVRKHLEAV